MCMSVNVDFRKRNRRSFSGVENIFSSAPLARKPDAKARGWVRETEDESPDKAD